MKNLLFLIICLYSVTVFAIESTATNDNKITDSIPIYEKDRKLIVKDILLYKNSQLEGLPDVVISKDYLSIDNRKIFFQDLNKCLGDNNCQLGSKVDFFKFSNKCIYLEIEKYLNNVGVASSRDGKLFFKIGFDNFTYKEFGNNSQWREYYISKGKEDVSNYIVRESLKPILKSIESCIELKSVECLKKLYVKVDANRGEYDDNSLFLKERILARAMLEDKKLCAEFQRDQSNKDWLGVFPEKIINKADIKNHVFWEELSLATKMDVLKSTMIIRKSNFDSVISLTIENHLSKEMACENKGNLVLKLINTDGVWKIKNIETYLFLI